MSKQNLEDGRDIRLRYMNFDIVRYLGWLGFIIRRIFSCERDPARVSGVPEEPAVACPEERLP